MSFVLIKWTLIILSCIYSTFSVEVDITVDNSSFTIKGFAKPVLQRQIYHFLRIPYAKPPTGARRFRHPEPLDVPPWKGVYDSTVPPFTCWQHGPSSDFDKFNFAANMWFSKINMSEDCLYLTIWTPNIDKNALLPVMVWVYGGSYMAGSSMLEVYDGSILSSTQNVVVINLQFRLGPLGYMFLDHPESPGNQALMDQRMAFQWIKTHIKHFGGDSNRITAFGESSGATSLSLHLFSKLSNDLFQRVILQSGTILAPWAIESSASGLQKAKYLVEKANCSSFLTRQTIQCLRNLPASEFVTLNFLIRNQIAEQRKSKLKFHGYTDLYSDGALFFDIYFRPIIDDYFIARGEIEKIIQGSVSISKELLMGTNANEAMFFLIYGLSGYFNFFNRSNVIMPEKMAYPTVNSIDPFRIALENIIDMDYIFPSLVKLILYEYDISSREFGNDRWDAQSILEKFDKIGGDYQFICPTVQFADAITKRNNPKVFMYLFDYRTSSVPVPQWVGVMHGYEIEYVFGMPFSTLFNSNFYSFNSDEKKTSTLIMNLWANFARFGDPTPKGVTSDISWPTYNTENRRYLKISKKEKDGITVNQGFKKKCLFWNRILPTIRNSILKDKNYGCSIMTERSIGLILKLTLAIFVALVSIAADNF